VTFTADQPRRLDVELVSRGLARSRGVARELIVAGRVRVAGQQGAKAATEVTGETPIQLDTEPGPWVGRAAYKLLGALERFGPQGLVVAGKRCLDSGASTGGFTQVLLAAGAQEVVALDVGHGQLAPAVAGDQRVVERSGTNLREVRAGDLGEPFGVVVADLSFISLRLVLGQLVEQTSHDGDLVLLVKPQFEVCRAALGKNGVVRSAADRRAALLAVIDEALQHGLGVRDAMLSPLPGGAGNVEYLLWVTPSGQGARSREEVSRMLDTMEPGR
jgi:23S rRNA (cytidine1920-2'-O)/16S rRNA (cytidine1409-2'-O)-methyltransferase